MERDEALDTVKLYWPIDEGGPVLREAIETLVPELKESEDERIRKELIQYLKDYPNLPNGIYCRDDFFAWLEKQGSQNLDNSAKTCKVEPKFKVGDTIHEIGERHFFPMVIEKIKDGDYVCDNGSTFINIEFQDKYELVVQNPTWSEEDEKTAQRIVDTIMKYAISPHSIINGDKPNLEYAQEFESWLKSLKFRIQPQWKPSDEQMGALDDVISSRDVKYNILSELWKELKKLKG